jgi:hypothetical protein
MSRRIAGVAGVLVLAALLATGAASAAPGGQGTVTVTQHQSDVQLFSMTVTNQCTGASGTLTGIASNSVFHVTAFTAPGADEFWVTGTSEGTVTFTPDDPSGISASGHFTSWFGESSNNKNDVQHDTNTFVLTGTDGSHAVLHMDDHLSTNANGVVTVNFSNAKFTCG